MGGISIWQLIIIAVIVVLLFGTNKLRTLGADLGASIKGFKKAMGDEDNKEKKADDDADFNSKLTDQQQSEVKKEDTHKDKA
ncbi:MAG: Sec-independent protein translocase protein TatA [Candidatus Erwinia impunctatus]|nr:Sec-independent protein translocase protein TatA [Culicoides impunctatus]